MNIEQAQGSWDKIAEGGKHVAGIEGDRFAGLVRDAIGKHVAGIANGNDVEAPVHPHSHPHR